MTCAKMIPIVDGAGRIRSLDAIKADVLEAVLALCRGNVSLAARRLSIGRTTYHRHLKAMEDQRCLTKQNGSASVRTALSARSAAERLF